MNDEIKAIIEKNLPAQVGETLKLVLQKAEQDAKTVKSLEAINDSYSKQVSSMQSTIDEYKKLDERNRGLDVREAAISERERNQKVFEAELKLTEAEKRINDNSNLVGMVFKSPIYRTVTSENSSLWSTWSNTEGRNIDVPSKNITEDTTTVH